MPRVRDCVVGLAALILGCENHPNVESTDADIARASSERAVDALRALPQLGLFPARRVTHLPFDGAGHRRIAAGMEVTIPERAGGALRFELAGSWVTVTAEGLADVPSIERDGIVVYPDAFDGGDVVQIGTASRVEELRLLYRPTDHHRARYSLRTGPGIVAVRVREGRVECVDAAGRVRLGTAPLFSVDARGERRSLDAHVSEAEGAYELVIDADTRGMTAPIGIDPAWSTVASMAYPRSLHASVGLADGKILVAGGRFDTDGRSTAEIYDPGANTWTTVGALPDDRSELTLARLGTGNVIAAGGNPGAKVLRFDVGAKTWSSPPTPASMSPNGRAFTLPNGKVLVLDQNGVGFVYDDAANTWVSGTAKAAPPGVLAGTSATVLGNGLLLIVGGQDYLPKTYSTAQLYDPSTDQWTTAAPRSIRGDRSTLVTLSSGKALIVGGRTAAGDDLSVAELYDPATNAWTTVPPFAAGVFTIALPLAGGRAMVVDNNGSHSAVFVESGARWAEAGTFAPGLVWGAGATTLGGDVVVTGGIAPSGAATEVYRAIALGQSCALAGECGSTFCVGGAAKICCDRACDGPCEQCAVAGAVGTCTAVSGAPSTSGSCAPYASCVTGACAKGCAVDGDCVSSAYCDGGVCVAKKPVGSSCSVPGTCANGRCVDGYCCDSVCSGLCEACDVVGSEGTCAPVVGEVHGTRTKCVDAGKECGQVCDGNTRATCVYLPAGTSPCGRNACALDLETHASTCNGAGACGDVAKPCGGYNCGALSCKTACASKLDCAAGHLCALGACIVAPGLGDPCKDPAECATGYCVDGACCAVSSCGLGATCAAPGSAGRCSKLSGIACSSGSECASSHCVDGVCCESACTAQCAACDVPGQLGKCAASRGKSRGGRAACAVDVADPCASRTCDGVETATCAGFASAAATCRAASCKDGEAIAAASCDGTGSCPAIVKVPCGDYACGQDACRTLCSSNTDCAPGRRCEGGLCRPAVSSCTDAFTAKIGADGVKTSCAPFLCKGGECPTTCATTDDCVGGTLCREGQCVAPTTDDAADGCGLSRAGGSRGAGWWVLALIGAALARRRLAAISLSCASALSCAPATTTTTEGDDLRTAGVLAEVARAGLRTGRGGLLVAHDGVLARSPNASVSKVRVSNVTGAFEPLNASLDVSVPMHADGALTLSLPSHPTAWITVTPVGLASKSARIVQGAAVYLDVAPSTDLVHVVDARGAEELRVVRAQAESIAARWTLRIGPALADVRLREGKIEIVDQAGRARISAAPMLAIDAAGTRRSLDERLERSGDEWILSATLDARGLAAPITIDPAWSVTADVVFSDKSPFLALLPTGDVFSIGPSDNHRQRWNVSTSTWTQVFYTRQIADFLSTSLSNGKVLLTGLDWFSKTPASQIYDPSASSWSAAKGMSQTREFGQLIRLSSSRILAAGGANPVTFAPVSSAEVYDPALDDWTLVAPMPVPRADGGGVLLLSGKALLAGGNGGTAAISTAAVYDPASNTWSSATLAAPRYRPRMVTLTDGRVLVFGGDFPATSTAELYDPATNTFSPTGSLRIARPYAAVARLPSGRVLAAGGVDVDSGAEVFDPTSGKWLAAGSLRAPRITPSAIALNDGRVMIVGGNSTLDGPIFETEIFTEQPAGAACTGDGECTSGFCADGYCCNSACKGACQACNLAGQRGTCSATSGAPLAGHASCAPYLTCTSGSCAASCANDADCAPGSFCGGGVCTTKNPNGASCTRTGECQSAFCVDGRCCNGDCTGQCESCAEAGSVGTCTAIFGTPRTPRAACSGSVVGGDCGLRCDGANGKRCVYPPAGVSKCSAATCAAGVETHLSSCDGVGACNDVPKTCGAFACGATKCITACSVLADCAAGFVCKAGSCVPAPGIGQACGDAAPCDAPLSCTDGVCCAVTACGAGASCALPASRGTCAKIDGQACTANGECGSGSCTDGVCCESSCSGQCQACDVPGSLGKCVAIKGAPHGPRIACAKGDANVCETRSCDGTDGSICAAIVGAEIACREATCEGGVATASAGCNGSGACPDAVRTPCSPYRCDASAKMCAVSCVASDECTAGYVCKDARCAKAERRCSDDASAVLDPEGRPSSCAPFVCKNAACIEKCTNSDECIAGTACDAEGRCLRLTAVIAPESEDSGGCATSRPRAGGWPLSLALLSLLSLLRRRVRGARESCVRLDEMIDARVG